MDKPLDIGENLKLGWETFTKNAVPLIVGLLLTAIIGGFTLGICMGPMVVGYNKMVLKAVRGEETAIGDVFEGFQVFVPAFLLFLIMGIALAIGFTLLIIPGLILAVLFAWAPLIMADGETDFMACLKQSVEYSKNNVGPVVVFLLVAGVINGVGSAVPFGSLITGPIAAAMLAHGYTKAFGSSRRVVSAAPSAA